MLFVNYTSKKLGKKDVPLGPNSVERRGRTEQKESQSPNMCCCMCVYTCLVIKWFLLHCGRKKDKIKMRVDYTLSYFQASCLKV